MREFLSSIVGGINDHGKELIIKAAFYVAAADGKLEESEKKLLGEIGTSLNMTLAHFNGVIDSVSK